MSFHHEILHILRTLAYVPHLLELARKREAKKASKNSVTTEHDSRKGINVPHASHSIVQITCSAIGIA